MKPEVNGEFLKECWYVCNRSQRCYMLILTHRIFFLKSNRVVLVPKRKQVDFTPEPNQVVVMPKPKRFCYLDLTNLQPYNCVALMLQKSCHFGKQSHSTYSVSIQSRQEDDLINCVI